MNNKVKVKDVLTAAEAIFGFCAWLTTREKRTVMSCRDDAAPIVELISRFCAANNFSDVRDDYHKRFGFPISEERYKDG